LVDVPAGRVGCFSASDIRTNPQLPACSQVDQPLIQASSI
jgi:hypothetical protein